MATSSQQRALIIHDASKQLCISLRNVVIELSLRYGDKVELLVITEAFTEKHRLHAKRCGLMLKSKTHSSTTINKHKQDIKEEAQKTLVRYSNSAEFKEMLMFAEILQVEFEITVEAGMLKEIAVEYAKAFRATHVILGRKLRKELKYFIEHLSCGIARVKSDSSIEIVRPPQLEEIGTVDEATSKQKNSAWEEWESSHIICSSCRNRRPWHKLKKNFTYAELQIATNGFCQQNSMSDHGSKSYLGFLNDQRKILIRENPSVTTREEDFQREVRMLEGLRHSNVALLIGSCSQGSHRFLVYEYICNGSLYKHLSDRNRELTWEIRINIAHGAAKGLEYLHEQGIYGSMRSSNILITHDFHPLLSYYGLINQYEALGQSSGQLPKKSAMRTFEHLAPEYHETGKELSKADVFSFGVVLLELITGRKTIEDTDGQSFLRWARPLLRQKKYTELTDPVLKDSPDVYQLYWLVRVANKCLSLDPKSRYSMKKVVKALSDIINRSSVEEFSPTDSDL
ncbi:hypothetical protein C2S51_002263 [Perilla frutescens var. frutescens]|nr:hypothetical protein C2S51_002263 [Perilla frutescens var. frutescens]